MEENQLKDIMQSVELDALSILMDSGLYLELPLAERRLLLKHIVEFCQAPPITEKDC